MEHNIGAGLVVGAAIGTSLYIYNSDNFNQVQKTVLLICIIFPPLQWVGILIVLGYNSYRHKNSKDVIEKKKVTKVFNDSEIQLRNLNDLKEKGILTVDEYNQKAEKIKNSKLDSELKLSADYKKLLQLFDDGILTKQEFEDKVNLLKGNHKQTQTFTSNTYTDEKGYEEKEVFKSTQATGTENFQFAKTQTIVYRLTILLVIVAYPFGLLAIAEYNDFLKYNPNWLILYWIAAIVILLKMLKKKTLVPILLVITVLFTILTYTTGY
jgi:hypothetical protein